jgi:hypothetical protein
MNARRAIALLACLLPAVILAAGCGQQKPADPTQFKAYDPKVKPLPYAQAHGGMNPGTFDSSKIPPEALSRMSHQIPGMPQQTH